MNDDDDYLTMDVDSLNASADGAILVLESAAETLRDAPDDYRCSFSLSIEEVGER